MNELNNFTKDTCACGYTKSSQQIQHKCVYSGWGQFFYSIGISAIPIRVNYFCIVCGEVIESTNEPRILKQFVGR